MITDAMIRAATESRAKDDEGTFESLGDLIGFSGENKTRTVVRCALEAAFASGTYSDKQKEWLARYLATGLASGPGDKIHHVDIDKWIADVKRGFDLIDKIG